MFRTLPYIALFLTAALSQIFIFDNLSVSVYVAPLVYLLFIVLLPVESSRILMLSAGIVTGFVMDAAMGTSGLNSIATIFIAFFRAPILNAIAGRKQLAERGVPSGILMGNGDYVTYLVVMVLLHHAIFFAFETLTMVNLLFTLLRFACSSVVSLIYIWLMARLFTINNLLK